MTIYRTYVYDFLRTVLYHSFHMFHGDSKS